MTQKNILSSYKREEDNKETQKINHILMVVEGKTEEEYFNAYKIKYNLCEVTVIKNGTRTSPLQIVQALERAKTTVQNRKKSFAVFFAVFDHCKKDPNTGKDVYNEAIKLCKEKQFTPITSKPSFEFWLLLHFKKTNCSMTADEATKELNKLYRSEFNKDYKKGSHCTFKDTIVKQEYIQKAKEHSEQIWNEEEKEKGSYTNVHKLIQETQELNLIYSGDGI